MSFRLAKLRFRRLFRRRKKQLADAGELADLHLDRHFIKRLGHLWQVRRFVGLWVLAVIVLMGLVSWQTLALAGYYQHPAPAPGGVWREGIVGQFTNANPIYATSAVDQSVSQLVFAGLFRYNADNQLVGDLARGYSLSKNARTYTIYLRPGLTWQDGQPLTAADVAFTYHAIQDPLAQSPLASSWQGVNVNATGPLTVTFTLPNPLSSFKYSLTNGIVPKHILGKLPPAQLRSANFNTVDPVGAGPFAWRGLQVSGSEPDTEQELIALSAFTGYHAGAPKLGGFVIHTYPNEDLAVRGLQNQDVYGLSGLDEVPASLKATAGTKIYSLPMTAETFVFFKTTSPVLQDAKVRQALVLAANRQEVVSSLPFASQAEREPLLPNQLAYNAKYLQPNFDLAQAQAVLKSDGWQRANNGYWQKGGQTLSFDLYSFDSPEFRRVVAVLERNWAVLGVQVNPYFEQDYDFENTLSSHDYDAVLHTIALGVDPDEYVYWDSSQADVRSATRLNLSEYKSSQADASLEAGRTRSNPELRAIKYQKFLAAWQQDYPALALYQPHFLYVTNRTLYNFSTGSEVNSPVDRYDNVLNWEFRQTEVTD